MNNTQSICSLLSKLIAIKGKKVKFTEIETCLLSSSHYPSVLSISHTLSYLGMRNKVYRSDLGALKECGKVAITHLNVEDGRFVLVYNIEKGKVFLYDPYESTSIEMNEVDFNKLWSGVVLLASEEMPFSKNHIKRHLLRRHLEVLLVYILLAVLLFSITSSFFIDNSSKLYLSILFSKIVGVFISILLLMHTSNFAQSFIKPICSASRSFSCDNVLQSKYAKFFLGISFTDIGFTYFLSGLTTIVISKIFFVQETTIEFLAFLSYCCLPYVCFSIVCQKYFIKKWCPLCLFIIGLIFFECVVFAPFIQKVFDFNNIGNVLIIFTFTLILSIFILLFIKWMLRVLAKLKITNIKYLNFKRSKNTFLTYFSKCISLNNSCSGITLGNKVSPITITTIVNPLCKPCKKKSKEIIALLEKYPHIFQWNIRFDGVSDIENRMNEPQLHLLEICKLQKSEEGKLQLIKDWINCISFNDFLKLHPLIDGVDGKTKELLKYQLVENELVGVNKIPFICLNNLIFPEEYEIPDLEYLVHDSDFRELLLVSR